MHFAVAPAIGLYRWFLDVNCIKRFDEKVRLQAFGDFLQINHDNFLLCQARFIFTQASYNFDFFGLGDLISVRLR